MERLRIAYSDQYLRWNLGKGDGSHPTNPIRAKLAVELLERRLGDQVEIVEPTVAMADRQRLASVHDPLYVSDVLDRGLARDWQGVSMSNARTAQAMFAGTARLTEAMIAGKTRVAFNPQGAKHHAAYDTSEGFCVFNDMAWAAQEFKRAGLKPLYLDWDVNAGDGVQDLLEFSGIPTLSIHGAGIYPAPWSNTYNPRAHAATHTWHRPETDWYNWNLARGSGDAEFRWAIDQAAHVVADYAPDVILLATGADGHKDDMWGIKYTYGGFQYAAQRVAQWATRFCEGRVLIGGAGGYRPHDATPRVWANVVADVWRNVR